MADMFGVSKRSEIMSRIKSKNSKAEKLVFSYLRKQGVYHQKHYTRASGNPDIALPRKKRAVFIDGDFWHGRDYDRILKSRGTGDYWPEKIARNMERDKTQRSELTAKGWEILIVWESDIKRKSTQQQELDRIKEFLIG
jgi:DNA mismatch endonuclease (patch repair protein)